MCQPDLTPLRYYWSHVVGHDLSVTPGATQECVDWDHLKVFLKERRWDRGELIPENGSKEPVDSDDD